METAETGNKNCCLTEARHVLRRKLSFRAFPERFCPRSLLLENVDYFETLKYVNSSVVGEKKRRIIIMKRLTGLGKLSLYANESCAEHAVYFRR